MVIVQKMLVMKNPGFTNPSVWLWIQDSEARANQCEAFARQWLPVYDVIHSVYRSSKNERLNDVKTRAPPTTIHLVFLLKMNDERATKLRGNMRREFKGSFGNSILQQLWLIHGSQVSGLCI